MDEVEWMDQGDNDQEERLRQKEQGLVIDWMWG
jgi:hypothetical protein